MSVPEIEFLVKIPDNMSLSVAAMLPSGALWALNTVQKAESVVQRISEVDELTHKRLGASRQQGVSTSAVRWRNDTVTPRPGWSMETIGEKRPFRARVSIPIEYLATKPS